MTTQEELEPRLWAVVDDYVTERVTAQSDADQQTIDGLNTQLADANARITELKQELADAQAGEDTPDVADTDLNDAVSTWVQGKKSVPENEATRQALITWQEAKGFITPPPPPPVETNQISVGCRNSTIDWATFEQKFGPVACTRFFHSDLPDHQVRTYSGITVPDNVILWVSFRDGTTDPNLISYLKNMDPRTVLIFHHEPEGDYASGKAFTDAFDHYANIVHTESPGTWIVHAASGYNYGGSRPGTDGSYLPTTADAYTIDSYQGRVDTSDMEPLEQDAQFQKWLSLVQPLGKPIGITEYGRGMEPSTDAKNAKRIELFQTDNEYLSTLDNFVTWQHWWAAKTSSDDWTFADPAGQQAWRDIATQHNG